MCAWSLKDYVPSCKLYVQILKPENRLHLGVADHIVVEGELKHALLANNSHCPGISTLVYTWKYFCYASLHTMCVVLHLVQYLMEILYFSKNYSCIYVM